MIRRLRYLITNALLAALLLPARVAMAHGTEEYHWLESEYRDELYLQLGAIAACAILFGVVSWVDKRLKRRTICKG